MIPELFHHSYRMKKGVAPIADIQRLPLKSRPQRSHIWSAKPRLPSSRFYIFLHQLIYKIKVFRIYYIIFDIFNTIY